jgi:hypothetical protein
MLTSLNFFSTGFSSGEILNYYKNQILYWVVIVFANEPEHPKRLQGDVPVMGNYPLCYALVKYLA